MVQKSFNLSAMNRNSPLLLPTVVVFLLYSFVVVHSAPESAIVQKLPGFNGTFLSKHYSGYINIDDTGTKHLFYYFVESESSPSEDPVVLWLNGGPGCSSFDGFVYEHGPFNFEAGESLPKLHINPYRWSKVSNIIYLDSPVGIGLSYSVNTTDYVIGDLKTASDSHKFLLRWFEHFPEFQSNPFFIAGESYAGVFVPMLAYEVVKGNDVASKPLINIKGYLVGNGVTDDQYDGNALVPFAHGMGLISNELFQEVSNACQGNFYSPLSDTCDSKLSKVDEELDGLNIYNILEPCYHGTGLEISNTRLPHSFRKLGESSRLPVRKRMFGRAWPFRAPVREGIVPTWPQLLNGQMVPCTDDTIATMWLNSKAVREAIHAEKVDVIGSWELCTDKIMYSHDAESMMKYHKNLTTRGVRALIFSGDHDMCVPYTGSEAWTKGMGYAITDEWRPWTLNGQVVGYTQGYANNLTFLTIKGAGHTVAEYKPQEALSFYSRFLAGDRI